MNKRNYQHELDKLIQELETSGEVPTLLLHSCCAPCSSYVLEYLSQYFKITVLYYNPNIYPESEYRYRAEEQKRFISLLPVKHPISFVEGDYIPKDFYQTVKGLEHIREGGERCFACYRLRLTEAANAAKELGLDYFATTLTISPLKNASKLNEIGEELADTYHVRWLPSDFKKKNGYKRSTELSHEYGMYRQDYCGCVFSYRERHPEAATVSDDAPLDV
ncbi:MAG: epoxyqueuosine reductase QueH [Lachnospiraceae bacterium]